MGVGIAIATRYTKTSILAVGSFLGLSPHSYRIQEVVVCRVQLGVCLTGDCDYGGRTRLWRV